MKKIKTFLIVALLFSSMHTAFAQVKPRLTLGNQGPGKTAGPSGAIPPKHKTSAAFFGGVDASEELKDKYSFDVWISEDQVLHIETKAHITEAKLQVFTPEQLAVRKGLMHKYSFSTPVSNYEIDLNAGAFPGKLGYWLYVTTAEGLRAEAYFQRR